MAVQDKKTDTKQKAKPSKKAEKAAERMALPVLTSAGNEAGRDVQLPENPFFIQPNKHVLWLDVTNIRNHQRQGTAKTKEKGEITGSTRKLFRQKGTGRARKGSKKSGILRGGARIFGPKPRTYGFKMNRKEKKLARQSALSIKRQQDQLIVIEDFSLEKPSAKNYTQLLNNLTLQAQKVLWITPKVDKNMVLSSRNASKSKVTTVDQLNSYDLLNATKVVCLESTIPLIVQKFT